MRQQGVDGEIGVIDLGDGWDDEEEVSLPPKPGLGWQRRAGLAAMVLVVLVSAAAAARPQGAGLRQLALRDAVVSAMVLVGADTVAVRSREAITGWNLADGALRWQVPVSGELDSFFGIAGLLVVSQVPGTPADGEGEQPPVQTTAYDAYTGKVRWYAADWTRQVGGRWLLAYHRRADGAMEIEGHDPRDYRLLWRTPASLTIALDEQSGTLWRLSPEGEIVEHDLADGTARRSVAVPVPTGERVELTYGDDVVGLVSGGEGAVQPDGSPVVPQTPRTELWFDRATLRPSAAGPRWAWQLDCGGGYTCGLTATPEGPRTWIIDAATGRPVVVLAGGDRGFLPSVAGPLAVGFSSLWLGPRVDGTFDPLTGGVRPAYRDWYAVQTRSDLVSYLVRPGRAADSTYLGELRADGELRMIGELPYELKECLSTAHALICSTTDDRFGIWQVEAGPR
ncbi:hypothetical protein QEZ54_28695 [Catellatospora sp. KI3]|uniref:hypothetical protein n=1 Tax=Catellatospora sp. KI3 TaxID=3041620 RepID=UPI0024832007|nr:hypothetical protein [Catellatospora sp. KI3]MDI1464954.1 hypothetical protein [Catellatospora sp. KI3]